MMANKWMVCVRCYTYNQSRYINDALNGFVIQQTNFPFICTIIDDASTDGEPEILESYFHDHFDIGNKDIFRNEKYETHSLLYAQHKENKNCFFAVILLNTLLSNSLKSPRFPITSSKWCLRYCTYFCQLKIFTM